MSRTVTIEVVDAPPNGAIIIAPRPFDHWGQRLIDITVDGVAESLDAAGLNTECAALVLRPSKSEAIRLHYTVAIADSPAPTWVWRPQDNALTVASDELARNARRLADGAINQKTALRRLIDDAVEHFGYGHTDTPFNDGCDAVPLVCGLTTGSCVDINTYLLAGARTVGITGQYIAGYWFHPEKTRTADMHCWLAFQPDGKLEFWDVAHGLKWADSLGAKVEEGLNPAGGRRVAMSCGRGLTFDTPNGPVTISHFSEPVWVLPDGGLQRPDFTVSVQDTTPNSDHDPDGPSLLEARRETPRQLSGA